MEPVSTLLGVASGAATLAALAVTIGKTLNTLISGYRNAPLIVYSIASTCKAIEVAWDRIYEWATEELTRNYEGDPIFQELIVLINGGRIFLEALHLDLGLITFDLELGERLSRKGKLQATLHENTLKDHCDRLNHQVSSLHLLLSAAKLPSAKSRENVIKFLQPVFRKDEESAWTVVNSHGNSSRVPSQQTPETGAKDADSSICDRRFTFDYYLFTAPVYRRVFFPQRRIPQELSRIPEATAKSIENDTSSTMEVVTIVTAAKGSEGDGNSSADSGQPIDVSSDFPIAFKELQNDNSLSLEFSNSVYADCEDLLSDEGDSLTLRCLPLQVRMLQQSFTATAQERIDKQFIDAVKNHDDHEAARLLDCGANINAVDSEGRSALEMSISHSGSTSCLLLLYHETRLPAHTDGLSEQLDMALRYGSPPVITRLLDQGGAKDQPVLLRKSLCCMSTRALPTVLAYAQKHNINPDRYTTKKGSPLHLACESNLPRIAMYLLDFGCCPFLWSPALGTPAYQAVRHGQTEVLWKMIEHEGFELNGEHAPEDKRSSSLLDQAVAEGHTDTAALLLSRGSDIGDPYRLLCLSNRADRLDMLGLLIANGCWLTELSLVINVTSALIDFTITRGTLIGSEKFWERIAMVWYAAKHLENIVCDDAQILVHDLQPAITARLNTWRNQSFDSVCVDVSSFSSPPSTGSAEPSARPPPALDTRFDQSMTQTRWGEADGISWTNSLGQQSRTYYQPGHVRNRVLAADRSDADAPIVPMCETTGGQSQACSEFPSEGLWYQGDWYQRIRLPPNFVRQCRHGWNEPCSFDWAKRPRPRGAWSSDPHMRSMTFEDEDGLSTAPDDEKEIHEGVMHGVSKEVTPMEATPIEATPMEATPMQATPMQATSMQIQNVIVPTRQHSKRRIRRSFHWNFR